MNADDPSAPYFSTVVPKVIRYGTKSADLMPQDVKVTPAGSSYHVKYEGQELSIKVKLPGAFNVSNSLATVGVGLALGLKSDQIEHGIAALETVEGRMNRIDEGQDFNVIVDFAHTPDSFEKLLGSMRKLTKGRLIVLFGSAGRRDEAKRALQGAAAGKFADVVVVTEEDDRDADGQKIMEQIAAGAEAQKKVREKDLFLVHDRTEAINFAVNLGKKDDLVLLLGKGHEKTIERADGEYAWDELATARAAIKARKN